MIAPVNKKIAPRIGKLTLLNVLNPRAVDPNRHIMLGLTRHSTCMTANTLALVDDKGIFRHKYISPSRCFLILPCYKR